MALRNTPSRRDQTLPHPARENRSDLYGARPASFSGESRTKVYQAVLAKLIKAPAQLRRQVEAQ
jgi:hypothetical protein